MVRVLCPSRVQERALECVCQRLGSTQPLQRRGLLPQKGDRHRRRNLRDRLLGRNRGGRPNLRPQLSGPADLRNRLGQPHRFHRQGRCQLQPQRVDEHLREPGLAQPRAPFQLGDHHPKQHFRRLRQRAGAGHRVRTQLCQRPHCVQPQRLLHQLEQPSGKPLCAHHHHRPR